MVVGGRVEPLGTVTSRPAPPRGPISRYCAETGASWPGRNGPVLAIFRFSRQQAELTSELLKGGPARALFCLSYAFCIVPQMSDPCQAQSTRTCRVDYRWAQPMVDVGRSGQLSCRPAQPFDTSAGRRTRLTCSPGQLGRFKDALVKRMRPKPDEERQNLREHESQSRPSLEHPRGVPLLWSSRQIDSSLGRSDATPCSSRSVQHALRRPRDGAARPLRR